MAVKPSPPPFDPNQKPKPSTGNANDTAKPKPKPGPMPPSIDPPQRPPSQTGFDFERWKANRPQTRVIMPGQGQGPMPIGTRPLPQPVVKDARGELGGGLMGGKGGFGNFEGRIPLGGFDSSQPEGGWTWGNAKDAGRWGNPGQVGDPRLEANDPRYGGGMGRGGDVGFGEDPNKRYGGGIGGTIGYGDNDQMRPGGFGPRGDGGMGRGGQYDPSRDFKGPPGQGGQQISPQYGNQQIFGGGPKGSSVDTNYGAPVERNPQGPKMGGWNNQLVEGTPEYGDWMRRMNERNGGAPPSGGKPPQGAPPPQDPGMGGQRPPRPNRPPQGRPPVNPQQMQQGAQELYNDNTIPHEFKGQLLQAAQSGDPMAFNQMLFNSNIPHATKLKLQQMFGYGGQGGAPTQSAQPDQGQQQVQGQEPYNSQGSPYYGAF